MSEHMSPIPSRIYNAAVGGHVCGPEDVDFGQKVVHIVKYDKAGNEVSFESQVTQANKIYVIHDDFTLSSNIKIPANCVLEFDGGSLSGNYNIVCDNTYIDANYSVFDCNVKGTVSNSIVDAVWIKNPTSEKLQFLIDYLYSGQTFRFDNKEYNLTKNLNIPSTNPVTEKDDQPCIQFKDKDNIIIDGNNAVLKVNVHAQGIVEICHCSNTVIKDLTLEGYGQFIPQDTTSGHEGVGEKGGLGDKYYTTGELFNYCKNNCRDTSDRYQYRTADNPTGNGQHWGTFGNGYIGNMGIGLLVYRGSENVCVDNIKASGFNFAGIQVGFMMDNQIHDLNGIDLHSLSKNIKIENCVCHDCYNAGIGTVDCDKFIIQNNTCHDFGFFDGFPATYTNDGYGIYHSHAFNGVVTNGLVIKNTVYNCARKGIDFHSGDNSIISENRIYNCYSSAIYALASSEIQRAFNIVISNNSIYNCGQASTAEGVIHFGGLLEESVSDAPDTNIKVTGNLIQNSGKASDDIGPITLYCGKNVVISDNFIITDDSWGSTAERQAAGEIRSNLGIIIGHGSSGAKNTANVSVKNNVIKGKIAGAIRAFSAQYVTIDGNEGFATDANSSEFMYDNAYNNSDITVINNVFHNSVVTSSGFYAYSAASIENLTAYNNFAEKGLCSPYYVCDSKSNEKHTAYMSAGGSNTIPIKSTCSAIICSVDGTGETVIILTTILSDIILLGNPSYLSISNEADKCYLSKDTSGTVINLKDNRSSGSGYNIIYKYIEQI